jgi:hypothetical protein
MNKTLLSTFLSIAFLASSQGGIGETAIQLASRYGSPKESQVTQITDKARPLVEGAIHHTYDFQGWQIRAAFLRLDGPAVRMEYMKKGAQATTGLFVRDDELQAIAAANTPPGMKWDEGTSQNPRSTNNGLSKMFEGILRSATGSHSWTRTDGARMDLESKVKVTLEMPVVREYEAQLKAAKEKKAKDSVPRF